MKQVQVLLAVILIANTGISQVQSGSFVPKTSAEKELVRLTKLMSSASEKGDSLAYEKYIDKNFLSTFSRCSESSYGKFFDKASVIALWTKKDYSDQRHSTPTVFRVQVSGRTAIVHSYILDDWLDKDGKKITAASWATDVWTKTWKAMVLDFFPRKCFVLMTASSTSGR